MCGTQSESVGSSSADLLMAFDTLVREEPDDEEEEDDDDSEDEDEGEDGDSDGYSE